MPAVPAVLSLLILVLLANMAAPALTFRALLHMQ
jgi:hypothetical protein